MQTAPEQAIAGCLLGCALGDSLGLPYEGLSTRRARRLARLPLRHRFLPGMGMISDDTDHSILVLQALIVSGGEPHRFRGALAWRLRGWLLCLPAGIGMATLKSIVRLWLGFSRSGVYSAGNGPSMRSAIIGATLAFAPEQRRQCVRISTEMTHTDERALAGAMALSEISACLANGSWTRRPEPETLLQLLFSVSGDTDWCAAVDRIGDCLQQADPLAAALEAFGTRQGISGYTLHSVPFALVAWYVHFGDLRATLAAITQAGGDVDTVGAMAGALAGTTAGPDGLPGDWLQGLRDWPHSTSYMRHLARRAAGDPAPVRTSLSPWLLPRGLLFMGLVLLHGLRRLLPPW